MKNKILITDLLIILSFLFFAFIKGTCQDWAMDEKLTLGCFSFITQPNPPAKDRLFPESTANVQILWSFTTGGEITSSPVIRDINHDGYMEILMTSCDGKTYLLDHNGQNFPNWPRPFPWQEQVPPINVLAHHVPATADIDNDGEDEIIARTSYHLFVWKLDGSDAPGWPRQLDDIVQTSGFVGSVSVADLDGDGYKEIITGHAQKLFVFNCDGTSRIGWPKEFMSQPLSTACSTPVIADIDANGSLEIIFEADIVDLDNISKHLTGIWYQDGTMADGWPQTITYSFQGNIAQHLGSPVVGDIDQDNQYEILVPGYSKVVIYALDGTIKYPVITHGRIGFLGIGDMNNDHFPEIMVGWPAHTVYLYNYDCSLLPGWPLDTDGFLTYSPVCADVDGDNQGEYILADGGALQGGTGKIQAWNIDGSIVPGFPVPIFGSGTGIFSAPAIGDINNDGLLDMVAGSFDNKVYMWNLNVPFNPKTLQWPQYHHDAAHTGLYRFNYMPHQPVNPYPQQNAMNVPISLTLHWICGVPADDENPAFDVYFGTVNPPPKVASGITDLFYDPGLLSFNTEYFWRIVANNTMGGSTTGQLWQFTTCDSAMTLNLQQGLNLVSFNYAPNSIHLADVVQPLTVAGKLVIAQDKGSGVLWPQYGIDTISPLNITKGYKIRMASDTTFSVGGVPVVLPVVIELEKGWNLIGYPAPEPRDALNILQSLLLEGTLITVLDENNAAIYNNGMMWMNEIGDFKPGEGYYVKVSANTLLNVY